MSERGSVHLFPVQANIEQIMADIQESGGVITEEQEAQLEKLLQGNTRVCLEYAKKVVELDQKVASLKKFIDDAKARSDAWRGLSQRLRGIVCDAMGRAGEKTMATEDGFLRVTRKSPTVGALEVGDVAKLPTMYVERVVTLKPRKEFIKGHLKDNPKLAIGEAKVVFNSFVEITPAKPK